MEKPTKRQMYNLLEHLSACDEFDDSDKQIEQMANQIIALLEENEALKAKLESSERGSKRTIENLLRSQCDDGG